MEGLQLFLLIFQVVIAVVMMILVLLQKSDGDSLTGIGGGDIKSVISGKTSVNVMTKTTMVLIVLFMLNCLVLASISSKSSDGKIGSEIEKISDEQIEIEPSADNQKPDQSKTTSIPQVQ